MNEYNDPTILKLINDYEKKYNALMQAFHINMIRAYPNKSHEEVAQEIHKTIKEQT